jgi:hypothetical protein
MEHTKMRGRERYEVSLTDDDWRTMNWLVFTDHKSTEHRYMKNERTSVYTIEWHGKKMGLMFSETHFCVTSIIPDDDWKLHGLLAVEYAHVSQDLLRKRRFKAQNALVPLNRRPTLTLPSKPAIELVKPMAQTLEQRLNAMEAQFKSQSSAIEARLENAKSLMADAQAQVVSSNLLKKRLDTDVSLLAEVRDMLGRGMSAAAIEALLDEAFGTKTAGAPTQALQRPVEAPQRGWSAERRAEHGERIKEAWRVRRAEGRA